MYPFSLLPVELTELGVEEEVYLLQSPVIELIP